VKGSCLCKKIEFECEPIPGVLGNCHCSICRKSHGAAFVSWLIVQPESLSITNGVEYIAEYNHTPLVGRVFCRDCGCRLWDYPKKGSGSDSNDITCVAASSIDDEIPYRAVCHFNVASKAGWYEIQDDLPVFEGWPTQEFIHKTVSEFFENKKKC
jgi:hypothetical protein